MIWSLPEVIFYDEEKEKQVYEDELKPVFKINIIQKFFNQKKHLYTDYFYKNTFKVFFSSFKKELNEINDFLLGEDTRKKQEETLYIIDDEEDEEPKPEEEEDEEEENEGFGLDDIYDFYKKVKEWWNKIRRAYRRIKRLKRLLKRKWGRLKTRLRRAWTKTKSLFSRAKNKFINWLKKRALPWLRRAKNFILRNSSKAGSWLGRALRFAKGKIFKIVKFIAQKLGKKAIVRVIKWFFKVVLKQALKIVLKFVAGALTASGVGTWAGAIMWAALWAWDAYDVYSMTQETVEESADAQSPPASIEKPQVNETPELDVQKDLSLSVKYKEITKENIEKHQENLKDKLTLTLYNSSDYPKQIMGRIYEFYKSCDDWLQNKQTFVSNIFYNFGAQCNELFLKLVDFTDTKMNTSLIPKHNAKKQIVKKPNHVSMGEIMYVHQLINEKKLPLSGAFMVYHGVKINNKFKGDFTKDYYKQTRWKLLKSILSGESKFTTIERIDDKIKIFKFNEELIPIEEKREEKITLLTNKNELLYELYCRLVWIKENVPISL